MEWFGFYEEILRALTLWSKSAGQFAGRFSDASSRTGQALGVPLMCAITTINRHSLANSPRVMTPSWSESKMVINCTQCACDTSTSECDDVSDTSSGCSSSGSRTPLSSVSMAAYLASHCRANPALRR